MMTAHEVFQSTEELQTVAIHVWQQMNRDDILEAFRAHPMIGADIEELKRNFKIRQVGLRRNSLECSQHPMKPFWNCKKQIRSISIGSVIFLLSVPQERVRKKC